MLISWLCDVITQTTATHNWLTRKNTYRAKHCLLKNTGIKIIIYYKCSAYLLDTKQITFISKSVLRPWLWIKHVFGYNPVCSLIEKDKRCNISIPNTNSLIIFGKEIFLKKRVNRGGGDLGNNVFPYCLQIGIFSHITCQASYFVMTCK